MLLGRSCHDTVYAWGKLPASATVRESGMTHTTTKNQREPNNRYYYYWNSSHDSLRSMAMHRGNGGQKLSDARSDQGTNHLNHLALNSRSKIVHDSAVQFLLIQINTLHLENSCVNSAMCIHLIE